MNHYAEMLRQRLPEKLRRLSAKLPQPVDPKTEGPWFLGVAIAEFTEEEAKLALPVVYDMYQSAAKELVELRALVQAQKEAACSHDYRPDGTHSGGCVGLVCTNCGASDERDVS